jgi:uncharacterized protein YqhQ
MRGVGKDRLPVRSLIIEENMEKRFDANTPMQVGGQAVMEGVMMRGPGRVATAVRRADGSITLKSDEFHSIAERQRWLKLPVFRGAVGLVEMMVIGIQTLNYSAEVAMEDVGEEKGERREKRDGTKKGKLMLGLTVAFALLAGVALFFATPLTITTFVFSIDQDPFGFNVLAGGIRLLLLLGYLGLISQMKDVRRLFGYHGAEHKAVFAFEQGAPLDIASCQRQTRFHPRCGTSFLLVVVLSSILLFGVLDAAVLAWTGRLTLALRLATHLPLIPVVGGISYEFIRFSARHAESKLGKIIVAPGLWLQRITTREPDESQIEVALVAIRSALGLAGAEVTPAAGSSVSVSAA